MAAVDIGSASGNHQKNMANPAFIGGDFVLPANSIRFLFLSLAAFFVVRVAGMVTVPFTDTTEARYGEIARKMVETGNWITPQFDYGIPFWGKPPLHTWLATLNVRRIGEFGRRVLFINDEAGE